MDVIWGLFNHIPKKKKNQDLEQRTPDFHIPRSGVVIWYFRSQKGSDIYCDSVGTSNFWSSNMMTMETPASVWTAPYTGVLCSFHFFSNLEVSFLVNSKGIIFVFGWMCGYRWISTSYFLANHYLSHKSSHPLCGKSGYHAQYSKYQRHKRMVPSRRGHFINVQFYWWQHSMEDTWGSSLLSTLPKYVLNTANIQK